MASHDVAGTTCHLALPVTSVLLSPTYTMHATSDLYSSNVRMHARSYGSHCRMVLSSEAENIRSWPSTDPTVLQGLALLQPNTFLSST